MWEGNRGAPRPREFRKDTGDVRYFYDTEFIEDGTTVPSSKRRTSAHPMEDPRGTQQDRRAPGTRES